jgi:alkaline phosphatase
MIQKMKTNSICRTLLAFAWLSAAALAQPKAKNVILFIADGAGISSLNAASIHGHQRSQALYLHRMPAMALAATDSTAHWVTDAGAAGTAMATGRKTANRMVSAFRDSAGAADLTARTLLEYAEELGLSTGGISDAQIVNPLVSAFYAHHEDRSVLDEVFIQVLSPRFGDGIDILVGPGRSALQVGSGLGGDEMAAKFRARGYKLSGSVETLKTSSELRQVVLTDRDDFDLAAAVNSAIDKLSRNPKGFFLVVHSDCHLKDVKRSLDRLLAFDRIIETATEAHKRDTLALVTADHSYGIRVEGQRPLKSSPFLSQVSLLDDHTGEDVPVLASGPGSERVKGFVPNTRVFEWILQGFGWTKKPAGSGE